MAKVQVNVAATLAANTDALNALANAQNVHVFRRHFDPAGDDRRSPRSACLDDVMAIQPSALERAYSPSFFDDEPKKPYEMRGSVAIVCIDGPLMHRGGWLWDGYEAISGRFTKALSDPEVGAVLLKVSSPGGVCSGCFSTARAMREAKTASGKPVFAFADEHAFSAAYAMASVADEIYLPAEGGVGSVGVLGVLEDYTGYNDKLGIRVAVVTSGKQKADGHPEVALKPDVIARYQQRIDSLAGAFAEFVGESRGMSTEAVLKLEAACLYGAEAVAAGLANGVASLDQVLAIANAKAVIATKPRTSPTNASAQRRTTMSTKTEAPAGANTELAGEVLVSHAEFALAAGLPHDANRGDILAEMSRMRSEKSEILGAIGAKTHGEAIGKVSAMGDRAAAGDVAVTKLGELSAKAEANEAESLIQAAVREGKIPSNAEKARKLYASYGMGALSAHLDALVAQPALAGRPPVAPEPKSKEDAAKVAVDVVVLTAHDEKFIAAHGLNRDVFIAERRAEAVRLQAAQV